MKKMTSSEIRQSWIEFFESKQHKWVAPVSLIPYNDPSLLWINSGVATLKDYFSGKKNPPANRLVNSQKALRTNDFFNVGVTSRHHTLFEMLGNFSIGDYFKVEAIEFAFELLIKKWEINLDDLWFTVFEDDEITINKWKELGVQDHRILRCGRDRNFWDVGSGPCGPCTEIHYDRGAKYDPEGIGEKLILEDIENDRFVEIWNIVFSQFNNDGNNNYHELARKNIDTGAGLERIACISQDVPTNFDTDLFQPIIKTIGQFTDKQYDVNAYFTKETKATSINFAYRVMSDHLRAATFAIADGAIPSNKDRGYVLRRLIRRALVMANRLNITNDEWLAAAIKSIVDIMQPYYSYLLEEQNKIIQVINKEANLFRKTLSQGLKLFNESIKDNTIDNEIVFQLVSTYGFPIELIKEIAEEKNIQIDIDAFEQRFKEHQKISNAVKDKKAMEQQNEALLALQVPSEFLYDTFELDSKVVKLYDEEFNEVDHLFGDGYAVFEQTPFYATSGGQIHDTGLINNKYFVKDVIKAPNFQHVHHVEDADLTLGEIVHLAINVDDRIRVTRHHSVEHLLQSSLKRNISQTIKQEGAFKSPDKVTFDFQHHQKLTDDQLQMVEDWINDAIEQSIPIEVLNMTLEEAQQSGATAYFGEVYKKIKGLLRVIKMGDKSMELCGGTHAKNTKDIQVFRITNYYAKGSGSWRIEALASFSNLENYIESQKQVIAADVASLQNEFEKNGFDTTEFTAMANKLFDSLKQAKVRDYINLFNEFKKEVNELKNKLYSSKIKNDTKLLKEQFNQINSNKKLVISHVENLNVDVVLNALDELANEQPENIYSFIHTSVDKIQYFFVTNMKFAKENNINLNVVVKEINTISNGRGGGKPNFVRGGTSEVNKINDIIAILTKEGYAHA